MHGQYCLTTLRRVMQLAKHLSAFCRQRFSQSVTRSLWSKQLSRAFIEQTLVSTNISLGGKLSRLLRFFSRPSFPFFLSQTINENCTCCCVQSCFIDIEHIHVIGTRFYSTWNLSTTPIITTLVRIKFVSFFLWTLSHNFAKFIVKICSLILRFSAKVPNWVGSMNESEGLKS